MVCELKAHHIFVHVFNKIIADNNKTNADNTHYIKYQTRMHITNISNMFLFVQKIKIPIDKTKICYIIQIYEQQFVNVEVTYDYNITYKKYRNYR